MTNDEILQVAHAQHAIDCCCAPEDFLAAQNVVRPYRPAEGMRTYLKLPLVCYLVSYGSNVVVCCADELVDDVTAWLATHQP